MKIETNYQQATQEEIARLKKIIRRVKVEELRTPLPEEPAKEPKPLHNLSQAARSRVNSGKKLSDDDLSWIANVQTTKEPLKFSTPVELFTLLMPEVTLYKWQVEMLLQLAGQLTPGNPTDYEEPTPEKPFLLVLPAANGSGKDLVIISIFAIWLALTGLRNRVIITSSSFEQTKSQTEVHIREFAIRANKRFGKIFHFTQFHYVVPELGSEIKLFATDEEARAEGWHPYPGGKMALILNEAKSIREELFGAIDRCTGYSYLLYISSPGRKRGRMFTSVASAVTYPNRPELGKFFYRRISAFECPHIPASHIQRQIFEKGENDPWVRSSIYAEFSDWNEPVVIPELVWDRCLAAKVEPKGEDIGIGLDLSGGGDEIYCFVRKGNKVIFHFGCTQKDSEISIPYVDKMLSPWKMTDYVFRADNGGIGQAMIDKLVKLGWRVRRTNNQSAAHAKAQFLNLGAEMYFHAKRLFERFDIIPPVDNPKLKEQLCSRRYTGDEAAQGKLQLESKKEHIASGMCSPDRADAFVLCFASLHPVFTLAKPLADKDKTYTIPELLQLAHRGQLSRMIHSKPRSLLGRRSMIEKI